jgi:hypothetical protein
LNEPSGFNPASMKMKASGRVLGLTINEAKTSLKNARAEDFDFLGYTFWPRYGRDGKPYLGARASKKRPERVKGQIGVSLFAIP